ncbi:HindIII family type II restriction endonuclease [Actinobacillus delphinicola]|uniref:HindIII restriction endonuclease n=1 Tax=Actinobacillus delphinicola TaxID=51161 RepID=A0A448TVV7_9PAST|nr:HindIII family type II restriction endonuclease [Actinobacillus delphinicola]VEJ10053.1 HindIII restriction endonuclease [Actinobacillus delphinicola]
MDIRNIFYFKNIVDQYYPNGSTESIDIKMVVDLVKSQLTQINDKNFSEIMIGCFIPDLYPGMGVEEKLFTKLTELMVGEWWRRLGGEYNLPTKKSGTEDVELIIGNNSIICDVKVFRLGRSQKAPNVKDFIKLESIRDWKDNLNNKYIKKGISQNIIGGIITYSSLHEWAQNSAVYKACTTLDMPVIMLPYELLALILKYKDRYCLDDFIEIWNYRGNKLIRSESKSSYWNYINNKLQTLLNLTDNQYYNELNSYQNNIIQAVEEYIKNIKKDIFNNRKRIISEINYIQDIRELKRRFIRDLDKEYNKDAIKSLKYINLFRKF